MNEFDHYFRICLDRPLSSDEAKEFLSIVRQEADVEEDDEGVVMIYHINDDEQHCYDVRLEDDITAAVGDDLVELIEDLFPEDDFDIESSMGIVGEQFDFTELRVDESDKGTLRENYNRWNHQRWVDTMVTEGWRWGVKLDESAKTHPSLRPWDDLSEMHRTSNSKTVDYVIEQLEQMGYKFLK